MPEAGKNYENLHETCVIFIAVHDVLNGNRPIYVIERCIKGLGQPFNDGACIIYVNGENRDNSESGVIIMILSIAYVHFLLERRKNEH